jgi:plastocyanin
MAAGRARITWVIRGVLASGVFVLLLAALGNRPAADTPLVSSTPTVIQVAAAPPTATSQPFVERITSHISRETPAPYPTSTPGPASETVVSVVDFGYMPSVVRIHIGQTVAWVNAGNESHDITGDDDWHSGLMNPTVAYRHVFGFAGTFTYHCTIHLDMHGSIVVVP